MTVGRSRYIAGEETRILLLETAERLFAQRGFEAVTAADIRSASGQRNASVVTYYFGSKENLLKAILDHRLPAISAARDAMIHEKLGGRDRLTARDALWCLVQPLADALRSGNHYVGLLDRLLETDMIASIFGSAAPRGNSSGFAIDRAFLSILGDVPEEFRRRRIMMVYESVLRTLARYDRSGTVPCRVELAGFVDAWEGLLRAPISDETLSTHRRAAS